MHLITRSCFAGIPRNTPSLQHRAQSLVGCFFFIPGTFFLPKCKEFSPLFPGVISPPKGTTETFSKLPNPRSPGAKAAAAPRASRRRCGRGKAGKHYLLLGRSHRSWGIAVAERQPWVPRKGRDPSGARSGFPSSPSLRAATTRAVI